jgi:hypothetical protein
MLAPVGGVVAVFGVVALALSRLKPLAAFLASRRAAVIGRVVLAVAGLVAIPGSASALIDIAGRGP